MYQVMFFWSGFSQVELRDSETLIGDICLTGQVSFILGSEDTELIKVLRHTSRTTLAVFRGSYDWTWFQSM